EAEPGAQVTIKLDGNIIGKGMANEEGAWLVVPDQPLPKGSHEIVAEQKVGAGGAPIVSDQSVAVALAEDGKKEPTIALLEPGQATKVIQKCEPRQSELAEATKPAEAKPKEPGKKQDQTQIATAEPERPVKPPVTGQQKEATKPA